MNYRTEKVPISVDHDGNKRAEELPACGLVEYKVVDCAGN